MAIPKMRSCAALANRKASGGPATALYVAFVHVRIGPLQRRPSVSAEHLSACNTKRLWDANSGTQSEKAATGCAAEVTTHGERGFAAAFLKPHGDAALGHIGFGLAD